MALHTFSAILLLSLHLYLVTPDTIPCPFAPVDCTCIQTVLPSETEFQSAHCTPKSGVIPAFTGFGIYAIIDRLVLTFSAYSIPPRAFLAFKSIGLLSLQQIDTSKPVQQYWETHAFVGPLLKGFQVSNLAGVLPPPPPVVELGDYVEKLVFDNCHVPVNLTANGFSTFKKVDTLIISNTPVSKIDDQAFVGIGDTLQELRLTNTGITTFPTTALKSLTSLVRLDLSDNNMQKFTSDDFAPLQALELLILDGNNIGAAIDIGAFAKLPQAINGVSLARAGPPLGYVPSVLINQAPQIFTLSLAQDGIGAIRRGDFPEGNQIHWLDMSGNPISSIDNGALGSLTHLVSLQMNGHKLVSFDLASLSGISSGLETIELTGSDTLTELLISDLSLVCRIIFIAGARRKFRP